MKVAAIILAAGSGSRMKTKIKKQFLRIGSKPILFYSLEKFELCSQIQEVILVSQRDDFALVAEMMEDCHFDKVNKIVPGGRERQHSVFSGLKAIDGNPDLVVIHDSVRPFFSQDLLEEGIKKCHQQKAVIFAVPVSSTIKTVAGEKVTKTLNRAELWEVQTPQIFNYSLILSAYKKAISNGINATDDAMMVERLGENVHILRSDKRNIKITTAEDLDYANFLQKEKTFCE